MENVSENCENFIYFIFTNFKFPFQLKCQVKNSFTKLRNALELREKLLLRQIDCLLLSFRDNNSSRNLNEISFQCDHEDKILELLRNYGVYQNIECFLPYLENENEDHENFLFEKSFPSSAVIDNKKVSASIINLTLKESQNLIKKSQNLVSCVSDKLKILSPVERSPTIDKSCPFQLDNSLTTTAKSIKQKNEAKVKHATSNNDESSSKLKRNDTTTSSKKKTLKNISNLTLNSCGGSIILKNITNLTINSCKSSSSSSSVNQQQPAPKELSRSSQQDECSTNSKCEGNYYQCDFYDRLISQNEALKRTIVNQSICTTTYPDPITTTCMSPTGLVLNLNQSKSTEKRDNETFSINSTPDDTMSSITSAGGEDVSIGKLDANGTDQIEEISTATMMRVEGFSDHSPMIQCWLSKMMLEPETDQNYAEILEISNIV